ncbi:hypothetical protein MSG28_011907 [Choristoneura fumiferana]|uniref:Uncharacterized protein n=1 Tax=Choristoneura fumiferana TaxID=7141 RepID=A0ACC0KNE2_CHOFU|nr:hypothetical protein MSG28_011907 [Choristoneura fumiferana]
MISLYWLLYVTASGALESGSSGRLTGDTWDGRACLVGDLRTCDGGGGERANNHNSEEWHWFAHGCRLFLGHCHRRDMHSALGKQIHLRYLRHFLAPHVQGDFGFSLSLSLVDIISHDVLLVNAGVDWLVQVLPVPSLNGLTCTNGPESLTLALIEGGSIAGY